MAEETRHADAAAAGEGTCLSGFVALVGRPNSGKSTLINTMLGEELCVVTPLPQTTRRNLKGIYNDDRRQIVFVDTPGMHAGGYRFNTAMVREALRVLEERSVDVVGYMVDTSRPFGNEEDLVAQAVLRTALPLLLLFNKVDICGNGDEVLKTFYCRYPDLKPFPALRICATNPLVREAFLQALDPLLARGPRWYPEADLSDANLRFFVAEFIRKGVIAVARGEVPHAAMVEILSYKERENRHDVEAVIHVETRGQRGIIVGAGGATVGTIRAMAQREMYRLTGIRTVVKCHVCVTPRWRENAGFIRTMGYE